MSQVFSRIFVEGVTDVKFLKDLIRVHFGVKVSDELFVQTSGHGSLYNEKNLNLLQRVNDEGGQSLVIFDADNDFDKRSEELMTNAKNNKIDIRLFLYPKNDGPGDRESLLQMIANSETYLPFAKCFDPYMECLKGYKVTYDFGKSKNEKLDVPNRKTAIHNYLKIHRQESTERKRDYTDDTYWNIRSQQLTPLIDFLGLYFS